MLVLVGGFGQYLWIDRKRKFVVAQFSIGQPVTTRGESGSTLRENAAVMRALGDQVATTGLDRKAARFRQTVPSFAISNVARGTF